jgi:hypothetical protein
MPSACSRGRKFYEGPVVLYALKVPVGTKEPFQLGQIGISEDWEVKKTLLR